VGSNDSPQYAAFVTLPPTNPAPSTTSHRTSGRRTAAQDERRLRRVTRHERRAGEDVVRRPGDSGSPAAKPGAPAAAFPVRLCLRDERRVKIAVQRIVPGRCAGAGDGDADAEAEGDGLGAAGACAARLSDTTRAPQRTASKPDATVAIEIGVFLDCARTTRLAFVKTHAASPGFSRAVVRRSRRCSEVLPQTGDRVIGL